MARLLTLAGVASLAATSASADPFIDCFGDYTWNLTACEGQFGPAPNGVTPNPAAMTACLAGASAAFDACRDSDTDDDDQALSDEWDAFFQSLRDCVNNYTNPQLRQACIDAVLSAFKVGLEDILDDGAIVDACFEPVPGRRLLAQVDGDGQVRSVGASESWTTFALAASDGGAAVLPCARSGMLYAIYQTRLGPETRLIAADLSNADGFFFDVDLGQLDLRDARDLTLVAVYFSEQGFPVTLAASESIRVDQEHTRADWNRNGTVESTDAIEFLGTYGAQTRRADLNEDGTVDSEDVGAFLDSYINGN